MSLDENVAAWHDHIDATGKDWMTKSRYYLSLPDDQRPRPKVESDSAYEVFMRAVMGEGLVIPKGYTLADVSPSLLHARIEE